MPQVQHAVFTFSTDDALYLWCLPFPLSIEKFGNIRSPPPFFYFFLSGVLQTCAQETPRYMKRARRRVVFFFFFGATPDGMQDSGTLSLLDL